MPGTSSKVILNVLLSVVFAGLIHSGPLAARDVAVSMRWPEVGPLPFGSEAVLEFRNVDGFRLTERRIPLEIGQTALELRLDDVPGAAVRMRAGLAVGLRIVAATDTLRLADAGPVTLDEVLPDRFRAVGFAHRLRCDAGTLTFTRIKGGDIELRWQGISRILSPVGPQAPGLYTARDVEPPDDSAAWKLRLQPPRATARVEGQELDECAAVLGPALLPLTARGLLRDWLLELGPGEARLWPDQAEIPIVAALTLPERAQALLRFDAEAFSVTLSDALCRDRIRGIPHPVTVMLDHDGEIRAGCGGDPETLLQGVEWQVTSLFGVAVDSELDVFPELTMTFAEGRISGRAACNLYVGDVEIDAEGLRFGEMASTRVDCPTSLMALERRFLDALDAVTRFDFADDGRRLVFLATQTPIITARRVSISAE